MLEMNSCCRLQPRTIFPKYGVLQCVAYRHQYPSNHLGEKHPQEIDLLDLVGTKYIGTTPSQDSSCHQDFYVGGIPNAPSLTSWHPGILGGSDIGNWKMRVYVGSS